MTDAIVCREVTKRYGEAAALDAFDLTVPAGSILSLVVFGTPIKPVNIGGMALLVCGMALMGR